MIRRIVKMQFKEENIEEFIDLFYSVKEKIESMPGCHSVELMRDINHHSTMFTYSIWDSEEELNQYRVSPIFKSTWVKTKSLFQERAEAWSLDFV